MTQEELSRYEAVLKILFELEKEMAAIKTRVNALEEQKNG